MRARGRLISLLPIPTSTYLKRQRAYGDQGAGASGEAEKGEGGEAAFVPINRGSNEKDVLSALIKDYIYSDSALKYLL